MEFVVSAKKGGTKQFFRRAEKHHLSLPTTTIDAAVRSCGISIAVEGPYGCIRALWQFDIQNLRAEGIDIEVEISVCITCDDGLTSGEDSLTSSSSPSFQGLHGVQGEAEEVALQALSDEKMSFQKQEDGVFIRSISSSSSAAEPHQTCGPDGACCCEQTIRDEDITSTSSSHPRNIIRKTLEQALGESAVIVCGPGGLVDDVRRSVVGLSHERAVHKGTGAQGVWLHTEAFGY
ncbi:MAG: hypothetical protein M1827_001083 [Pycnora praestabilis]|nr:MAG: hypothetical protein M1827_001083 [Pycnora praestabilis]